MDTSTHSLHAQRDAAVIVPVEPFHIVSKADELACAGRSDLLVLTDHEGGLHAASQSLRTLRPVQYTVASPSPSAAPISRSAPRPRIGVISYAWGATAKGSRQAPFKSLGRQRLAVIVGNATIWLDVHAVLAAAYLTVEVVQRIAALLATGQLNRATIERIRDVDKEALRESLSKYHDDQEVERIMERIEALLAALPPKE